MKKYFYRIHQIFSLQRAVPGHAGLLDAGAAPGGAQLPRGVELAGRAAQAGLHRQEELHAALALARSQRLSVPGLHRF